MTGFELSARFFLQLAVLLAACRACAWAGRRLLQPPVVCEMVAGVLLGPSLLGWAAPAASAWLFPQASMPVLFCVSQLGLALYMFCVGLEFRTDILRRSWKASVAVSLSGILAPLILGGALGLWLIREPALFSHRALPWQAALFCGAS